MTAIDNLDEPLTGQKAADHFSVTVPNVQGGHG
jgi:hypothetical protein